MKRKKSSFVRYVLHKVIGAYRITEKATGREYFGSTDDVYLRMAKHESALRCGRHHNKELQKAYEDNGSGEFYDIFDVYVEATITKEEAEAIEDKNIENNPESFNAGFKGVRRKRTYTKEDIDEVVKEYIIGGTTYIKLSKKYGVPCGTIHRHVQKKKDLLQKVR